MNRVLNEVLYWLTFLLPWMIFGPGKKNSAALDVLYTKFGNLCISGEYGLREGECEIKRLRKWARELGPFERRAYLYWLSYFNSDIRQRRKELRKREQEQDFLNSGKFPKP